MIIKGRRPTMRHVSRTHRVALDRTFDRINFDSQSQVRHVETKDHLAEILTKDSLTRDEWNQLLQLPNIMSDSVFIRSHCRFKVKRQIEEKKPQQEEASRGVAKSRRVRSLVAFTQRVCSPQDIQGDNSVVLNTGNSVASQTSCSSSQISSGNPAAV